MNSKIIKIIERTVGNVEFTVQAFQSEYVSIKEHITIEYKKENSIVDILGRSISF
ncbi:hypothetical protein [Clostridium sp. Marseille-Q7071]